MSGSSRRHERVRDLFHAVLEHPPTDRSSFLTAACADDPELKRDVERLLAAHGQARSFLENPVSTDVLSNLPAGACLGPYEIVAPVGAGGMGEVYRGRDTRLGRTVAIKILPGMAAASDDSRQRFDREARALSGVKHPHICTLYDIGHQDGIDFLVMEYVEGETLAQRLLRGPLPLSQALEHAITMAATLEEAHRHGIVHRDLKPSNVMLAEDGVKLLDFGLARPFAVARSFDSVESQDVLTPGGTLATGVRGTVAYMSPEQARGERVDGRTDIWAFGCVLYEMLTGVRAFAGDNVTDTLVAIVHSDPVWTALPAEVPHGVRSLLKRCLQKDPSRRLHHIADARIELEEAAASPHEGPDVQAETTPARSSRFVPWLVAALAVLAAVGFALRARRPALPSLRLTRVELRLPESVELYTARGGTVAFSPDASDVAFIGVRGPVRQVYRRPLNQFAAIPIRDTEGAMHCFFAPDSASLGFIDLDGKVQRVGLADGVATIITSDAQLGGAAWGSDDTIVFVRRETLWSVPASGGTPRQLTTLDRTRGEFVHHSPIFIPNSTTVLFTAAAGTDAEDSRIEALVLPAMTRRIVLDRAAFPLVTNRHLLYSRGGRLLASLFNADTLNLTGPSIPLAEDIPTSYKVPPVLAASHSGSLVYAPGSTLTRRLLWVSRGGEQAVLNDAPRRYANPRVAPDGHRVVVEDAQSELWLQDTLRGTFTRLTFGQALGHTYPVWSPDGARLVYRVTPGGLYTLEADGSGRTQPIPGSRPTDYPTSISPDGSTLLVVRWSAQTSADIYALALNGASPPRPFLSSRAFEGGGQFSPDGRYVLYASNETGRMEVYVRSFADPSRKWQISPEGGAHPLWNRNGEEIFYRSGNKMMAVEFSGGRDVKLSAPRFLFEHSLAWGTNISIANYDVAPDGLRFAMVKEDSPAGRLNVVLDLFDEVARRSR